MFKGRSKINNRERKSRKVNQVMQCQRIPVPIYGIREYTISVYSNLPEEGCQQSFLSLLRERALCALYLYRSLDIKVTSLHN